MSAYCALSRLSPLTWPRHVAGQQLQSNSRGCLPAIWHITGGRRILRGHVVGAGININRRNYFDQLLQRQREAEVLEAEAEVTCPVHCVREVHNYREFEKVVNDAQQQKKLVVMDFYDTSCGACKYILHQVIKLCKKGCGEECSVGGEVVFIKHNIKDQYDELTDLARFYSIRSVPMFSFFVDGCRVRQFPTRDGRQLENTICQLLEQYVEPLN